MGLCELLVDILIIIASDTDLSPPLLLSLTSPQALLSALLKFLEPYLRSADLSDSVRCLYKVWT